MDQSREPVGRGGGRGGPPALRLPLRLLQRRREPAQPQEGGAGRHIYLSIYLSIHLPFDLSIYLSIFVYRYCIYVVFLNVCHFSMYLVHYFNLFVNIYLNIHL